MSEPGSTLGKNKIHLWKASARVTAVANTKSAANKKVTALEHASWRKKSGAAVVVTGEIRSAGVFDKPSAERRKRKK